MKLSLKQIKLEQIRMRNKQNPSRKDEKVNQQKRKLRTEYWKRVRNNLD